MDSWSYVCEGKGFVSDETGSPPESLSRSKNVFMGWELKSQCGFGNTMLVSAHQGLENDGLMKVPEMMRKQYPRLDSSWGVLGSKFSSGRVDSFDAFSGEEESNSKLSSSVVESNGRDTSFIDLKLGRFGDNRDAHSSKPSKGSPILCSSESYMPMKKARLTGLNLQTPICIVHGCNKDLSGSKDYHKRHKVCEVHSKTAKVIVNGIEQRFCQQCSRFHLLVEFDDGKRSCRKRLAGHNERRRKTHVGIHSNRSGRSFPPYNGNKFQESSMTTSFVCQDILPSGLLHPENYENISCCRPVKLEDEVDYTPQTIPTTHLHLHQKSIYTPYSFEKQFHPLHDNGVNGSVFENGIRYPHDLVSGNSLPCSLFQNTDFGVFATASTGQGLSRISDSGCALSLLSSQSLNSPGHSSGVPMARHGLYNTNQVSDKLFGVISQASTSGVSNNNFPVSGMNSGEGNLLDPIMISDGNDGVNFDVHGDGVYHGSDVVNSKDCLSCDNRPTIDLLQLSSQLQRVERQRQSMQMKPENDAFCCLRIT